MAEGSGWNRRKVLVAIVAALGALSIIVPIASALLSQAFSRPKPAPTTQSATASVPAGPTIKPLSVRPVMQIEATAPEQCPAVAPTLPADPLTTCDIDRTALYSLGPEALALQLTRVSSVLSPITSQFVIQVMMTPESAQGFGTFTAAQVNRQIAFVRDGSVVSAPQISESISSQSLQLTGNLTAQSADQIVKLLRDGS